MTRSASSIGQHLCIGFAGKELTASTRRLLHTVQPGGIVLFTRNIADADQLPALCQALRRELPRPPLIAIDQENGRVNRLRNIVGELPTIRQLQAAGDPQRAVAFGRTMGRWLRRLGLTMDFAPVLDLELFDTGTDNALRERCWGRTPAEVVLWAGAFARGLEAEGVAACPKHFPGLGGARQDSHDHLPTIDRQRAELLSEDLLPFTALLPERSAVMVGHGHYPAFDPAPDRRPATISAAIMTDLLRRQLGFQGLTLTDDLEMGAIAASNSVGQAAVAAFVAGADLLLVCHNADKILAAHEALTNAVANGQIPAARLAESQQRLGHFHEQWPPEH